MAIGMNCLVSYRCDRKCHRRRIHDRTLDYHGNLPLNDHLFFNYTHGFIVHHTHHLS